MRANRCSHIFKTKSGWSFNLLQEVRSNHLRFLSRSLRNTRSFSGIVGKLVWEWIRKDRDLRRAL